MSKIEASKFFNEGNTHLDADEYDKAIECYTQAIALDPKDTAAFYARGLAYTEKGEFDQAIKDYSQVIVLNPNDTAAFYARGSTYYDKGEFDQTIKDFNQVIVLNPNDTAAFYARGSTYAEKGEFYQAIKDYSQVIVLNPNDTAAFYARGLAYRKLGKEQEAIKDYSQVIVLNPKDTAAFYARGLAYRKLGKEQEAIKDFQKANQLDPTVIPKKEVEGIKKEIKEVQNFQSILTELRDEYKKGEKGWSWASILIVPLVFIGLWYSILYLEADHKILYPLYIFSSVITFFVVRQYTNAKQLRIEASNRLAMAKMFVKIQQTEDKNYQAFIPKIIDSIAYSMRKKQKESIPIDELLKHLKK